MKSLSVLNAFDQSSLATLSLQGQEECEIIFNRAVELFRDKKRHLSKAERIRILEKAAKIAQSRFKDLTLDVAREGGKPLRDAEVEITRGIEGLRIAARELISLHGTEVPMEVNKASARRLAFTRHEPGGVVLAISAFNHPFNLIVHQISPAVAAGCPVIIKPSLKTPLSCRNLLNILFEAGLPEGWCQKIICEDRVTEQLVKKQGLFFLSFIGSAKVGWHLRSILPPGAACALEHGGVAPVIIDRSADMDDLIPKLVKGAFYHAGQVCVSVQKVLAHEDIFGELTDRLDSAIKELKVGRPELPETDVGPLISASEAERVHLWVLEALQDGASLLCGGKRIGDVCYEPTVLLNPPAHTAVSCKEIFGPVMTLSSFSDLEAAFHEASEGPWSFQSAFFSSDYANIMKAISSMECASLMINDHTAFRTDWMPFGGRRHSGMGKGGIGHSLRDMMPEKLIVLNY